MTERPAPPIPARCAHRPLTPDGLVIPFGNVRLADGGCDFRSGHNSRLLACWRDGLCQVCGQPLDHPIVLLAGPRQLAQLLFDEPPVHPECARYVSMACPMVAGERTHYREGPPLTDRSRGARCYEPGCDCGGWVPTPGFEDRGHGGPAHPWFAVYVSGYALAARSTDKQITGGICVPEQVLRVRQVSEVGRALRPWRDVPDWADRYRPPELAEPAATR
jgi:hypothetical protein